MIRHDYKPETITQALKMAQAERKSASLCLTVATYAIGGLLAVGAFWLWSCLFLSY